MANPAFLVEGHLEQKAIGALCPGQPVQRINCNGKDVDLKVMAKFIETLIKLLGNRYYPIIVIVDREQRNTSARSMRKTIIGELTRLGVRDQLIVAVADRHIENWILADIHTMTELFGKNFRRRNYEGAGGKGQLKRLFESIGNVYNETTTGVTLLRQISSTRAQANSASLRVRPETS
jgi:hypothetical protein